MPSKSTTILPVRVEHELIARLEALSARRPGSNRTSLARDALRRGLQLLEAQTDGRADPAKGGTTKRTRARSAPGPAPAPAQAPAADTDPALKTFAYWVLVCARRCRTGRLGEDRLFINHAWRQYKHDQKPRGMTLDSFKARLLEAHQARLVLLASADRRRKLDPADVAASEIQHLSARFHFLCI